MKGEEILHQRPRLGNPMVTGPLRTGLSLVTKILDGAAAVRDELKYKLATIEWYYPRPDDLFIVSYPKSGTTLTQMIHYQLTTDGNMDIPHIGAVSPWFEFELLRACSQIIEAIPSPRAFKSHLQYGKLPRGAKYIYLVRRPEDVAVSEFHHYSRTTGIAGDLGMYLDRFIADQGAFGSWFKHVASWWPHRNDENVLWLQYEEMIADLEGSIRRIAAFSNLPIDETQMPRILECCSFAFMKQHDDKFDPRTRRLTHQEEFIRHGKAGAGAQALSPMQKEMLENRLRELARKLGHSVDDPYSALLPFGRLTGREAKPG